MTTKAQLLKLIRENCIQCMGGAMGEVGQCTAEKSCNFWPFRFGKDPNKNEAKARAARERAAKRWGAGADDEEPDGGEEPDS